MSKGILYDATLCIDCKLCEKGCAERNGLPYNDAIAAESKQSEHKFTVVLNKNDKYMRRLCMNCEDPSCVSVCPVGAFQKTAAGPRHLRCRRCMGCRYCMLACPFFVPKYEWGKTFPLVKKCDMCSDRVAKGQQTACADACPTGATKFGERDDLIAEAQQRIKDNPGQLRPSHLRSERSGRHFRTCFFPVSPSRSLASAPTRPPNPCHCSPTAF